MGSGERTGIARAWHLARPHTVPMRSAVGLLGGARRIGDVTVERLPVADAASEELRPFRHGGKGIRALGEQPPELRVVPAELVAGGVAVLPDAGPQALHLREALLA